MLTRWGVPQDGPKKCSNPPLLGQNSRENFRLSQIRFGRARRLTWDPLRPGGHEQNETWKIMIFFCSFLEIYHFLFVRTFWRKIWHRNFARTKWNVKMLQFSFVRLSFFAPKNRFYFVRHWSGAQSERNTEPGALSVTPFPVVIFQFRTRFHGGKIWEWQPAIAETAAVTPSKLKNAHVSTDAKSENDRLLLGRQNHVI